MPANDSWLALFLDAFVAQSGWEWLAAGLGILYVVLAARESVWCWPAAFISTLIYTLLFWEGQLPMQAILNVYYLGMAVYGFMLWKSPKGKSSKDTALHVSQRPLKFHLSFLLIGTLLTFAIGQYLASLPDSRYPFLDAAVTVFSVMNTVLMARKVIENWLYWLVINSAAIVLYWQSGFYVTIAMFMLYWVLAVYGYLEWRQTLTQQNKAASPATT